MVQKKKKKSCLANPRCQSSLQRIYIFFISKANLLICTNKKPFQVFQENCHCLQNSSAMLTLDPLYSRQPGFHEICAGSQTAARFDNSYGKAAPHRRNFRGPGRDGQPAGPRRRRTEKRQPGCAANPAGHPPSPFDESVRCRRLPRGGRDPANRLGRKRQLRFVKKAVDGDPSAPRFKLC